VARHHNSARASIVTTSGTVIAPIAAMASSNQTGGRGTKEQVFGGFRQGPAPIPRYIVVAWASRQRKWGAVSIDRPKPN
jgi:hypothetical protein